MKVSELASILNEAVKQGVGGVVVRVNGKPLDECFFRFEIDGQPTMGSVPLKVDAMDLCASNFISSYSISYGPITAAKKFNISEKGALTEC